MQGGLVGRDETIQLYGRKKIAYHFQQLLFSNVHRYNFIQTFFFGVG